MHHDADKVCILMFATLEANVAEACEVGIVDDLLTFYHHFKMSYHHFH